MLKILRFPCKTTEYHSDNYLIIYRYGLLGKKFKDKFGHVGGAILGGVVGLKKPDNHGVPYSLTEEFVSVYRMHSLLPDYLYLRDTKAAPGPNKSPPLAGKQMVSMGHQACGQLKLWNYPLWLRDLIAQDVDAKDRPDRVDMAALESNCYLRT
ncbi:hypothetical protein QQP08_012684 [Theobroma cacao]|nr:hypothetical protein QQP08_012684 [Theobroma cacao]